MDVSIDIDKPVTSVKLDYNLTSILSLRLQGRTFQEIANLFGLSKQAIFQKWKGIWALIDPEKLEAYENNRIRLFSAVEKELLELFINKEKAQKATLGNVAYAFTQIFNARRLESGQSTGIFSIINISPQEESQLEKLAREMLNRMQKVEGETHEKLTSEPGLIDITPPK